MGQFGILDQYDDGCKFLADELGTSEVPQMIKEAAACDNSLSLGDKDYALYAEVHGEFLAKYPVVDAGNTLVSAMYYEKYASALPIEARVDVARKLKDAMDKFGLKSDEVEKTASFDFELSPANDGYLEKLFGVEGDTTVEVLTGAFAGCSPRGKRRLAMKVKEASVEAMDDYRGDTLGGNFYAGMELRGKRVSTDQAIDDLVKIAESVTTDRLEDIAEELYKFDIRNKLTGQYRSGIPDAYMTVFGSSLIKSAEDTQYVEIDGREFTADELSTWLNDTGAYEVSRLFGEHVADQLKSDPVSVLESLPSEHKKVIAGMIDGID